MMKQHSERAQLNNDSAGFSILELLVTFALFSVAVAAIIDLSLHLQKNASRAAGVVKLENFHDNLVALIMDGSSWNVIRSRNGGSPTAAPSLIDIYDGSGARVYMSRSNPRAGLRPDGSICTTFSSTSATPDCPFRYDIQWAVAANASNPLVNVTATLRVSPGTFQMNSDLYSYNAASSRIITRQLFLSWVSQGSIASPDSVPTCTSTPGFTVPGDICSTAPGTSCLYCLNGTANGCPQPWQLFTCE